MKKSFLFLLILLLSQWVIAQKELYDSPVVLYKSQKFGGIGLHTSGLNMHFSYGKYIDATHIRTFGIEFLNMKHEKERKGYNETFGSQFKDPKGYYFGKVNSFLILRPSIGQKKIFTKKLRKKGVQLSQSWQTGFSLGFLKPIYLEIINNELNYFPIEKYDPDNHTIYDIFGRASVLKGLNELQFRPGLFYKYGLNFEYANGKDYLEGIEAGFTVDLFLNKIKIMAETINKIPAARNKRLFINLYLNFYFGRKEN